MDLRNLDLEKIALAVEADAGHALLGLRESLEQAKRSQAGDLTGCRVHTPEDIAAYKRRGRPMGTTKSPATLRIDGDALARWRATGKGWQTRAAAVLAAHAP